MSRNAKEIEALHHLLVGHGAPGLGPTLAQLETLLAIDSEGPLQFVNLLAFHDRASYPEGHELESKGLSGLAGCGRTPRGRREPVFREDSSRG